MYYLIFVTHPSLKSAKCDSVSIVFRNVTSTGMWWKSILEEFTIQVMIQKSK